MKKPKFLFADIVVINQSQIGVVVKTWERHNGSFDYEVYNRITCSIETYHEEDVDRYRIRHKFLDDQEIEWQNN